MDARLFKSAKTIDEKDIFNQVRKNAKACFDDYVENFNRRHRHEWCPSLGSWAKNPQNLLGNVREKAWADRSLNLEYRLTFTSPEGIDAINTLLDRLAILNKVIQEGSDVLTKDELDFLNTIPLMKKSLEDEKDIFNQVRKNAKACFDDYAENFNRRHRHEWCPSLGSWAKNPQNLLGNVREKAWADRSLNLEYRLTFTSPEGIDAINTLLERLAILNKVIQEGPDVLTKDELDFVKTIPLMKTSLEDLEEQRPRGLAAFGL